jgi:hypothetical protein
VRVIGTLNALVIRVADGLGCSAVIVGTALDAAAVFGVAYSLVALRIRTAERPALVIPSAHETIGAM